MTLSAEGGECVIGSNDCTGTNIQCAPVFGIPVCECVTGFAKNSAGDCVGEFISQLIATVGPIVMFQPNTPDLMSNKMVIALFRGLNQQVSDI